MDLPKGFLKDFIALLKHLQGLPQWLPKNIIDFLKDFIDLLQGALQEFTYFLRVS